MESRDDLAAELAQALSMLFTVAADENSQLADGNGLYTGLALTLSREALTRATAAGLLSSGGEN